MKKLIIAILALALILCLVGCEASETPTESKTQLVEGEKWVISIWTDEETGVQYIIYHGYKNSDLGGITPRLNADGTLYITEESEDTE